MTVHVSASTHARTAATSTRHARKTVTELYAEFEAAYAAYKEALATCEFDDDEATRDELYRTLAQPAVNKFTDIADRLISATAHTPQEMLLQIRVAVATNGPKFETLRELDRFDDFETVGGDALLALKSLRAGLRRLIAQ